MMEEDQLISCRKINYAPTSALVDVAVASGHIAIGLQNKTLVKIDPTKENNRSMQEMDLGRSASVIHHVFIDPSGHHVIVSLAAKETTPEVSAELLYMKNRPSNMDKPSKPRQVSRAKGQLVTAVGWNFLQCTEESTGPILLGTKNGLLFETELKSSNDEGFFQSGIEQYFKQIFDVGRGQPTPITGISFHQYKSSDGVGHFIFVTTRTRFYQFIGTVNSEDERPLLLNITSLYLNMPEKFLEFPSPSLNENLGTSTSLQVWSPHPKSVPTQLAWLTGSGIVTGKIDTSVAGSSDSIIMGRKLIHFPSFTPDGSDKKLATPKAIGLTEFHLLLLYSDRMVAICILNEQLVYEKVLGEVKFVGLTRDTFSGIFWTFSDRAIYKYTFGDERKDIWRIYMELGMFEEAKANCKKDHQKLNQVLVRQAENLVESGKFEESAACFAETKLSFEEVTLKFLELKQTDALRIYLLKKLSMLEPGMITQASLIVLWCLELFLQEMGNQRDAGKCISSSQTICWDMFSKFISVPRVKETMLRNKKAVYNVISSHGDKAALLQCAFRMEDYLRMLDEYIQDNEFTKALEFLKKQRNPDLYYRYVGPIISAIPVEVVEALVGEGRRLDPSRLLPSLTASVAEGSSENATSVIRYLEFCTKKLETRDPAVHHLLLTLLVKKSPEKVLSYLENQGSDPSEVPYCLQTALRICLTGGSSQHQSLIWLYRLLERYEEAVDKALVINAVDLAKETANCVLDDEIMKKRLWLKIARHIIEEENDVTRALQILQSCDQLKLEEILPFFPDFTTIDLFRDSLCQSLQVYSDHLDQLKEEMDEATRSAEVIRQEVAIVKSRPLLVKADDCCTLCRRVLLTTSAYVFPCSHKFHSECLEAEILPMLRGAKKERVHELKRQLASLSAREETTSVISSAKSERETLRNNLDDILAAECLYCGEIMINSVDEPFPGEESFEFQLRR